MWTCFLYSIWLPVAHASELFDHNGWVPVSSDIVYDQIRRGITQAPLFTKDDDVHVMKLNTDILSFVSQHQKYEGVGTEEDNVEDSTTYNDVNLDNEPRLRHENDISPNNMKRNTTVRRYKKLADTDSHVLYNHILRPMKDNTEPNNFIKRGDVQTLKEKFTEDSTHTYEVTENILTEYEKQEESVVNENGYEYNRPAKQNFTTDLIKHLSKYNIDENDNLQNYALSRRPKSVSPVKQDLLDKSIRFRVPLRYNSLNHLPVDPLIAVFLSHYGHYLRGQYGLANNYNNLYGYLASNNIHNNRPFGFYKLSSDTDSSNK